MTSDPYAAGPLDQGEWLQTRPGERCLIRVAAAETNGAYSVVEILSQPGDSTPIHAHQHEDEHFLILEGTARIVRGDETFDAPAGTTVALPRNIPHAWGNATNSTLRVIATCWPGGVEAILPLIARGGDIDVKALGAKFGVRVAGPPLLGGSATQPRRLFGCPPHRWINPPKWRKVARLRTCLQEYPCL